VFGPRVGAIRHSTKSVWSVRRAGGCHGALHQVGVECLARGWVPRGTPP